jgi:integrase
MRSGELLELKWRDIDFSQSRIAIRRALVHLKRNNPAS